MSTQERKQLLAEISKLQDDQALALLKIGLRKDVIAALKQLEGLKTQFHGILDLLK